MLAPLLLIGGSLLAANPVAAIVGPERASPGDLVVLDASQSRDAIGFAWVLADGDKTFLEVENGRKVVFATGTAGRYTFVLIAANAQPDGQPQVAVARHVLTIGEPGPIPPGPEPEPLPPGQYGLARAARDAALAVALSAAERTRTAAALANSFDSMASTIAAGAIQSPAEIIAATQANNVAALGDSREAWRGWAEALRGKLNELSARNEMTTAGDYLTAWREIAAGLRAVR